jgi:5-methylcytosine-specific restriction protein A
MLFDRLFQTTVRGPNGGFMSWGFEIGRVYNRRANIHARFGGQQQGGIISPAGYPLVVIVTGEKGLEHGYADRFRPDGAFEYFGEGQVGDMVMQRGNRAIAEHSAAGKSLLLFRKTSEGLRFEGEMVYDIILSGLPIETA